MCITKETSSKIIEEQFFKPKNVDMRLLITVVKEVTWEKKVT